MGVFWIVAPCRLVEVYQRFRGPCCLHHHHSSSGRLIALMMEAARTSEMLVNFYRTTWRYIPEDGHQIFLNCGQKSLNHIRNFNRVNVKVLMWDLKK
jgi:hypothetical protein